MKDLWRIARLMRPYAGWMGLGLVAALVTVGASMGLMATAGWLITAMAVAGASGAAINYFTPAALIRTFAILRSGGRYLERLATHEATLRLLAGLRAWLFERLEPLAPAGLQAARSGDLLSRLGTDVDDLSSLYLRLLIPVLVAALGGAAAVGFFALYDSRLALIALLGLSLAGIAWPWAMQRLGATAAARQVATAAALRSAVVDGIQGMAELAIYGRSASQAEAIAALSDACVTDQRRLAHLEGLSLAGTGLTANLTLWGGLILVIPLVGSGALDGPTLTLLAFVLIACFEAVASLPAAFKSLGTTRAAARRLLDILDQAPPVTDPEVPAPLPREYSLTFDRVSLRYGSDRPPALDQVSFAVQAGEHIALLGPTGSGKTSLVNLLARLWDCDAGQIRLGGEDIRRLRAGDLRRQIAVVSQDSHLFNTTIRENLLLARPTATTDELARACHVAQLGGFIATLPDGYDTQIGEAGVCLSGGQARRLAIARALLHDAPILVLDEPTEGLDSATARALMCAIRDMMAGRTLLLISHRLADLATVERIIFLDRGRVHDQGRHDELVLRCPAYRRLLDRLDAERLPAPCLPGRP